MYAGDRLITSDKFYERMLACCLESNVILPITPSTFKSSFSLSLYLYLSDPIETFPLDTPSKHSSSNSQLYQSSRFEAACYPSPKATSQATFLAICASHQPSMRPACKETTHQRPQLFRPRLKRGSTLLYNKHIISVGHVVAVVPVRVACTPQIPRVLQEGTSPSIKTRAAE